MKSTGGIEHQVSLFLINASAIEDFSGRVLQGIAAILSVANVLLDAAQTRSSARNELKGMLS